MGRVVVSEFVTLDGVMEDPGGSEKTAHGGWAFGFQRGAEGDRFKLDELTAADALLLGRTTYEGFAAAWPSREDDAGFAGKMNSMEKLVVSSTLEEGSWNNTTILRGTAAEEVAAARERFERDLLVAGSAQLVQALLDAELVDELRLMVFPTLLGSGKKLFGDGKGPTAFQLVEARQSDEVALLVLRR
ncbi:MAG TPA: dihydrofolate reductase family protein [Gaiellaceae bacterium]|nr:dihydrofolate reductase family protein [Gaiellaceae bacterium]